VHEHRNGATEPPGPDERKETVPMRTIPVAVLAMSDQRTSSGGTATSGGGSFAPKGEPQSVRDAYDKQGGKK
jgi:hypothetical protein